MARKYTSTAIAELCRERKDTAEHRRMPSRCDFCYVSSGWLLRGLHEAPLQQHRSVQASDGRREQSGHGHSRQICGIY
jgi:hypothetical protein